MLAAMKCPACQRNLLSRRAGVCSFCGATLPAELLLGQEQLRAIEAEERATAQSRKQRQERERRDAAGDASGWTGGWGVGDAGGGGGD